MEKQQFTTYENHVDYWQHDGMFVIFSDDVDVLFNRQRRAELCKVIDELGHASAKV